MELKILRAATKILKHPTNMVGQAVFWCPKISIDPFATFIRRSHLLPSKAIMGPSGAGKTTFMNVLCGKARDHHFDGENMGNTEILGDLYMELHAKW